MVPKHHHEIVAMLQNVNDLVVVLDNHHLLHNHELKLTFFGHQ